MSSGLIDEDRKQNMEFVVSFERVPWGISPKEAKELLHKSLIAGNIGSRLVWKISLKSVSLEGL